jgi:hypothetical protein
MEGNKVARNTEYYITLSLNPQRGAILRGDLLNMGAG